MKRFRLLAAYAAVSAVVLVIPRVVPAQHPEVPMWGFTVSTYGGVAIPADTNNTLETTPTVVVRMDSEGQDTVPTELGELRLSDIDLNNSVTYGGKVGVWNRGLRHSTHLDFGVELDVMSAWPNIDEQEVKASGLIDGVSVDRANIGPIDLDFTAITFNFMARYPFGANAMLPAGRVAPYVGLGGGFAIGRAEEPDQDADTNMSGVFQLTLGMEYFVLDSDKLDLAIFSEYVHTRMGFDFKLGNDERKFDVNNNSINFGATVHFGPSLFQWGSGMKK